MNAVANFIQKSLVIAEVEILKLRHDYSELITRAVQPLLWMLVFGQVLGRTRAIDTGAIPYKDFIAPGILSQSVLFVAIFYGITVIWERDLGITQKYLVSPAPREALVFGKAIAASVRGLSQAIVIFVISIILGVQVSYNPLHLLGILLSVALGSALFATLSLIIACLAKTRERLMGIGQLITMPLFFTSNAIYPVSLMPAVIRWLAYINPLTYMTDSVRNLMLAGNLNIASVAADYAVLISVLALFIIIGGKLYSSVVN